MKPIHDSIRGAVAPMVAVVGGFVLVGVAAMSGCEPSTSRQQPTCVPNHSQPCVCHTGGEGSKLCAPDGTAFGPCLCLESQGSGGYVAPGTASGTGGPSNTGGETMAGAGGGPDIAGNMALGGTGVAGNSGTAGTAGTAGTGGTAGTAGIDGTGGTPVPIEGLEPFSFFVTSLEALQRLSGSPDGFGGDLRYGEADGLSGADKICTEIAEFSMPGAGAKGWRAFLSASKGGPDGGPVHAIDRIGEGPWYDRLGRLVSMSKDLLMADWRPSDADPAIKFDLPNEYGVPNHNPDGTGLVDNHDTLTGSGPDGRFVEGGAWATCNDWTSAEGAAGTPVCGHTWPRGGGMGFDEFTAMFSMGHWITAMVESGCAPGVNLIETGPPNPMFGATVGSGGGYGGFYCFALTP